MKRSEGGKIQMGRAMKLIGRLTEVSRYPLLLPVLIIAAVSFAVYVNALFNEFVYDDVFQVTENQWITDVRYLPDIFTKSVWGFQAWASSSNYYRPMMHVTYMISYYLFGLTPWGFHLVNVLFHTANSVLVYLIAVRLSDEMEKGRDTLPLRDSRFTISDSRFFAFPAALLFATHPIHTEAVTWVAGLPEVSFTFFFLLSLYFYMRESPLVFPKKDAGHTPITTKACGCRFYALSVACFFLATLYKETALTLPAVLIAHDYVFRSDAKKRWRNHLLVYAPYIMLTGIYLAMRLHALGGLAPEKKHSYLSMYQYLINIFPLLVKYIQKLIVPIDLNAFYVFHPIYSISETKGIFSAVIVTIFVFLAVMTLRKNKVAFFAVALTALPLLPALYIPGLGENTFAERYLYLPSVGFAMLAALVFVKAKAQHPGSSAVISSLLIVVVGLYAAAAISRNAVWKNDLSLYSDTARKSPDGFIPNNNLGYALMKAGRTDEAMGKLKLALRLRPDMLDILIRKAVSYLGKGQLDEAMLNLNNVLLLDPMRPDGHYYLGLTYALRGWLTQAIYEYHEVLRLRHDYPRIHSNIAEVYAMQGLTDDAITEYETSLNSEPYDAQAANNLGALYLNRGRPEKAARLFQAALKLRPGDPTFRRNFEHARSMMSAARQGQ